MLRVSGEGASSRRARRGRGRTLTRSVACVATAALLLVPAAHADVEPNDGIAQFEGPIAGGVDVSGGFATENDVDWYGFYVAGQQQLRIGAANPASCTLTVSLHDGDGSELDTTYVYEGETGTITYTTSPGTNRFFLTLSGCANGTYGVRVDPGPALVPGPGRPQPAATAEPNENAGQPFGPLAGGVDYQGAIETSNDEDWFRFYALAGTQLDVAVTNLGTCSVSATLSDATGEEIDSTYIAENRVGHIRYTPSSAGAHLVSLTGCVGAGYLLRVDPAGAVTLTPPPPSAPPLPRPGPPPPPVGPTGSPAADVVAPRLRDLAFPRVLRRGRSARLRFALSEPARVNVSLQRRQRGRRQGERCTTRGRGASCRFFRGVRTLRRQLRAGTHRITIPSRVRGRRLSAGTYRVRLVATDAAGNRTAVSLPLRIRR